MLAQLPPYALPLPAFRFRALAALAGRAPLGGPREVALACYLLARLAHDAVTRSLPASARAARAAQAKGWFASLALPAALRLPLARAVEATGTEDPGALAQALALVVAEAGPQLDPSARAELEQLAGSAA